MYNKNYSLKNKKKKLNFIYISNTKKQTSKNG